VGTESGNFCALIYNPAQRESSYLHLILIKPTGFPHLVHVSFTQSLRFVRNAGCDDCGDERFSPFIIEYKRRLLMCGNVQMPDNFSDKVSLNDWHKAHKPLLGLYQIFK